MTISPRKNNDAEKSLKLSEIAQLVGGELVGDRNLLITGVAGIKEAQKGDITFLANAKYLPFLLETRASAVIVARDTDKPAGRTLVLSDNPSQAFTKVVAVFMGRDEGTEEGVHPTAVIGKDAHLGERVSVGAHAVIEEGARIGARSVIGPGAFVGRGAVLGHDSRLYPNVTVRERVVIGNRVIVHANSVIGSDGFGYETLEGKHVKIPQLGSVEIADDVEIGSGVCIDRGRFKNTCIGRGTKIDNLVQVAHNVVIGEDCLVISQVGLSGSAQIGNRVVIAGQAGVVGHVTIGDDAIVGARSGVSKSIEPKTVVLGEPARSIHDQKRILALIARLPELFKDLAELKKKVP